MKITYLETVLLYTLNKIHGDRTIYSLFHLFQGKRSSQTIQDAHLYQLTAFFQSFPSIKRSQLEKLVARLIDLGYVKKIADTKVILTAEGRDVLQMKLENEPLPIFLNGWKYYQVTDSFWERLTLLVQVCSNLIHNERNFIPIRNKQETLSWVKQYIRQKGEKRLQLAAMLYDELIAALEKQNSKPEFLTIRLTGYGKIGLTAIQAAELANVEFARYHYEFLNVLHAMLDNIMDNPSRFPLLAGLIDPGEQEVPLTLSTEKTFRMLQKGISVEKIAAARNLKQNTIEDHIVEIALSIKGFDITEYIPLEKQQRILQAGRKISAKKLKQIREQVNDASYFEIRLVLAKYGDAEWN